MALYGMLAEFEQASALLDAVRRARELGLERIEAYSPFSIEGIDEAIGPVSNRVPLFTLLGGIVGAVVGYFIQWYSATINYPLNVGGRPLHSWPAFLPVSFELAVLFAAFAGLATVLGQSGLPRLMHPLFEIEEFRRATIDRFFLCIRADDPAFDEHRIAEFLTTLAPLSVYEVPE